MYKLYYSPGACSMAIHIALNECSQPVELQKLDLMSGEGQKPEFLKLNPSGQVPLLMDGDQPIREGAAILIHLLEKHDSPLLPKSGKARTQALEWLMFCNASLHPAYARMFFLMKNKADAALIEAGTAAINKMWANVEQHLSSRAYLCGDTATIADILLTVIANWSARMPQPISIGPNTKKLLKNIVARPAYQKALSEEQVEYKAAA